VTAVVVDTAQWTFNATGTRWCITSPTSLDAADRAAVRDRIEDYERVFSRFRPDSTVTSASREAGSFALPAEADDLFTVYRVAGALTDGAVNPLVGGSLEALGYGPEPTLRAGPARRPAPAFDHAAHWDGARLHTRGPIHLDVGAAGKGQLADLVLGRLRARGLTARGPVVVDAGGDLVRDPGRGDPGRGNPGRSGGTERIGLESPFDAGQVIGVVTLGAGAVAGSGIGKRAWAGHHHIVDARSGVPTRGILATWAIAPSALLADISATSLFFAGVEEVRSTFGTIGVRIRADGSVEWIPDPRLEIFT